MLKVTSRWNSPTLFAPQDLRCGQVTNSLHHFISVYALIRRKNFRYQYDLQKCKMVNFPNRVTKSIQYVAVAFSDRRKYWINSLRNFCYGRNLTVNDQERRRQNSPYRDLVIWPHPLKHDAPGGHCRWSEASSHTPRSCPVNISSFVLYIFEQHKRITYYNAVKCSAS